MDNASDGRPALVVVDHLAYAAAMTDDASPPGRDPKNRPNTVNQRKTRKDIEYRHPSIYRDRSKPMVNLKKPIGDMLPTNGRMVSANEFDTMAEVAKLMEGNESLEHLSQIPLRDNTGKIRHIVTGNGLARWGIRGRLDEKASEFSEAAHKFPDDTLLEKITDVVAIFGYVLVVTNEDDDDDRVVGILSYTEVIRELTR